MRLHSRYYVLCLIWILATCLTIQTKKIFPGTKWCGDGSVATSWDDLGTFAKTDMCCRKHDQCPDYILGHNWKYGLHNTYSFTCSECQCDFEFRKCLKSITGIEHFMATQVGITYFSVLKPLCFFKIHGTPCLTRYYDEHNVSYKNDGGGKYFCVTWYQNRRWYQND